MISNVSCKFRSKPLETRIAISFDPGTRNFGYCIIKLVGPISFNTLQLDTNYQIIWAERVDFKKDGNGVANDGSLADMRQSAANYFGIKSKQSNFTLQMTALEAEYGGKIPPIYCYSESQDGISDDDLNLHNRMADWLSPGTLISGTVTTAIDLAYHDSVKLVHFPTKVVKWGNSSAPVKEKPAPNATRYEKLKIYNSNKNNRKNFFVYYILDLLERQNNVEMLAIMGAMNMEDRAHMCDAITQGMRALMIDTWCELDALTRPPGVTKLSNKIPENTLPADIQQRVFAKLNKSTVKYSDGYVSTKKTKRKTYGVNKSKKNPPKLGGVVKRRTCSK